jgi:hypothetical protein
MKDILTRASNDGSIPPFAPAGSAERQSEIFTHDHPSPFMLHVYEIRPAWRERLSAVTHVDQTGRCSRSSDMRTRYYDLIQAFERRWHLRCCSTRASTRTNRSWTRRHRRWMFPPHADGRPVSDRFFA